MCWSWPVSLSFSLFQWAIILYMLHRNKYMDRWLALMQIPVATQEFIQFLLWAFAIDHNTTKESCSTLNQYLSYNITVIVMSIPPLWAFIYVYKSSDFVGFKSIFGKTKCCDNYRQKVSFLFFIAESLSFVALVIVVVIYDVFIGDTFCSYKGRNGHQEWVCFIAILFISYLFYNLMYTKYHYSGNDATEHNEQSLDAA